MNAFVIHKKFLHVYKECTLETVIKAPDTVVDFVLCQRQEEAVTSWQVVVLTSSNCVYVKTISGDITNGEEDMSGISEHSDNQDIFGDLVDQEKCGPITVVPVKDSVIHLESHHRVLHTDTPLIHINVTGNLLLTLSSSICRKITAYKLDDLTSGQEALSAFELECPSVQYCSKTEKYGMYVVLNSGDENGWISTSSLCLPTTLFVSIFKSDAALLHSPVILYTLNGCVFYHQVKSISQSEESWQILSDIEGSVESIFRVQWKPKDEESDLPFSAFQPQSTKCNSGVLVCSSTGKAVYLYTRSSNASVRSETVSLPGPVVSCQTNNVCVYHCTGRRLYKHVIRTGAPTSGGGNSVSLDTELLHESWVDKFSVVIDHEDDKLLCQSPSGEILTLSTRRGSDVDSCPQGTHSFKELLMGMENNNKRLVEIHHKQKLLNDFLQQVSIVGQILSNKSDKSSRKKTEPPVSCTCCVSSVKNGYKREYTLVCRLTNLGPLALSQDWSLMVVMETNNQTESKTRTHSMPLSHGLKSGSSLDMRCPLNWEDQSFGYCDIRVYMVLHSDLLVDLDTYTLSAPVPETSSSSLPALVTTQRLDILYYLHEPIKEIVSAVVPSVSRSLSSLVRKKTIKGRGPADGSRGPGQLYSISVNGFEFPAESKGSLLKADDTADKVLQYLLKDSQVDLKDVSRGQLQLVDPLGHLISITITTDKSETDSKRLQIQLGSERVELLAECRAAIVQRLETVTCEDNGGITVMELRQYLARMENLKEELGKLEEKHTAIKSVNRKSDVAEMYQKLRKIQL